MGLQKEIKETLTECGLRINDDIINQLYNTAIVESGVRNIRQYGGGPALGYFQMEPATRRDIVKNYLSYRKYMRDKIEIVIGSVAMTDDEFLENVPAQIVFAWCHYERYHAWKSDTLLQAISWKYYYNTPRGKGTVLKFIERVYGFRYESITL